MASPPAKRQRTSKAVLLDDEEEEPAVAHQEATSLWSTGLPVSSIRKGLVPQQSAKPTVQRSKHKQSKAASNATTAKTVQRTDSPSPSKPKKSPRKKNTEDNNRSLHTFFSRATEGQRWKRETEHATKEEDDVETRDAIEDDDDPIDKAFPRLAKDQGDVKFQVNRRKDQATLNKHGPQTSRRIPLPSTHKFVKPTVCNIKNNSVKADMEDNSSLYLHRPWADRYSPANLEELAVHKKKAAEVRKWLGEVLNGRDPRVCAVPSIIPSSLILTRF